MTALASIQVDPDTVERIAFAYRLPIERSEANERMYVRHGDLTYWAPSPEVTA